MNDAYLKSILGEFYNIKVRKSEKVQIGYSNENYVVYSKNKTKYMLRISPFYRIEHLWLESYILNNLRNFKLSFEIPHIIKTFNNKYFLRIGNQAFTLFKFIPGTKASRNYLKKESFIFDLANKTGMLHHYLSKIKIQNTKFGHEYLINSYFDRFKFYEDSAVSPNNEWKHLLLERMSFIKKELVKYKEYYEKFPFLRKFVHTDLRLDNILLKNGKISAILDFDDILIGDQAFDLASMFVEIFADHNVLSNKLINFVNINGFVKFIKEYIKTRKTKNRKSFIGRVINLLNLQALQVLSIVGRDPDFDEKQRIKNIIWYSNFIRVMNNKDNKLFLKSSMKDLFKS